MKHDPSHSLSQEEKTRYSRHLILPEVGLEGQLKMKAAKVLVVGAGGLGSPVALYLAAAGIGTIGIVDFDLVDSSNLQRQILHSTDTIGEKKSESAKARILSLNPSIQVNIHNTRLNSTNCLGIIQGYDIVIDGTDNFPTRYLVNDACVILKKPNVYGSIFRFEGQISLFESTSGPCYRCLYPSPPPPGMVPGCGEGGVLGILPGTIGTLQATEAIKWILGVGKNLKGRLVLYNALDLSFKELKFAKNPSCPVCGDRPTISKLIDYEDFCGIKEEKEGSVQTHQISPQELWARFQSGEKIQLVDVREPLEWELVNLSHLGSKLIPLNEINENSRFPAGTIFHCKTGIRSQKAIEKLNLSGSGPFFNLKGGITAWVEDIEPELNRY